MLLNNNSTLVSVLAIGQIDGVTGLPQIPKITGRGTIYDIAGENFLFMNADTGKGIYLHGNDIREIQLIINPKKKSLPGIYGCIVTFNNSASVYYWTVQAADSNQIQNFEDEMASLGGGSSFANENTPNTNPETTVPIALPIAGPEIDLGAVVGAFEAANPVNFGPGIYADSDVGDSLSAEYEVTVEAEWSSAASSKGVVLEEESLKKPDIREVGPAVIQKYTFPFTKEKVIESAGSSSPAPINLSAELSDHTNLTTLNVTVASTGVKKTKIKKK